MSYIQIPNPRPKNFWHSTDFILKRVHRHQPSPEEFTAYLEENRVRHGVPTAVDRWISAGLTSAPPRACSAQENRVPTQQRSPIFFFSFGRVSAYHYTN